jgi:hypothetical protein
MKWIQIVGGEKTMAKKANLGNLGGGFNPLGMSRYANDKFESIAVAVQHGDYRIFGF